MSGQFEFEEGTKVGAVFDILSDRQWHCRTCEYKHIGSTQIAGSGGIQGLKRGNRHRPGLEIKSGNHFCKTCETTTYQDKWTGQVVESVIVGSMPQAFMRRVVEALGSRDVVDRSARRPHELTVDHKLPMIRWSNEESKRQTDYGSMSDADIRQMFQLLKASNGSVSHNLLKSRACERCFKTGKRGKPLGIAYFYSGGERWEPKDKKDSAGCVGCGWHDFAEWRSNLNKILGEKS